MPAEWEPHRATWIAWPHHESDWPGKFAGVPWTYVEIVRWLARGEIVEVVVQDRGALLQARRALERSDVALEHVRFHAWRTDRSWTRDSGPTFVVARSGIGTEVRRLAAIHWRFNGWAKYDNWRSDRRLPERIAKHLHLPRIAPTVRGRWVVLEGGAVDVDGRGTLLATEECLLRGPQRRNPGLSRSDLHQLFARYLGVGEVIWLPRGILGDDTHGHIDDVARFVAPRTVVAVAPHGPSDPNARALARNLSILRRHRDSRGRRLSVIELPSPEAVRFRGETLPASYANFYVANASVLVPTFDDPADARALAILSRAFPGRTVVGIAARDLVWGLGTVHCLTQQEPVSAR